VPLFQKDPDKEQARQLQRQTQEAQRRTDDEAQSAVDFEQSPEGRARTAWESGQQFFQISVPISRTESVEGTLMLGSSKTQALPGAAMLLESIEKEGWRLEHAGFVFQEVGSVSRNKIVTRGQKEHVNGFVWGIYLFRRRET
jgi:hypothetical protein